MAIRAMDVVQRSDLTIYLEASTGSHMEPYFPLEEGLKK